MAHMKSTAAKPPAVKAAPAKSTVPIGNKFGAPAKYVAGLA